MAKVLQFPVTIDQHRARLANSEAKDWQLRKMSWAAQCASSASSYLTDAVMRLLAGETIGNEEVVMNGETLADILTAALCNIDARASNGDRDLARAIRIWLEENDQGDDNVA